ncbi:unnamed protein product, partial [Meganyctiphanes norvegica]
MGGPQSVTLSGGPHSPRAGGISYEGRVSVLAPGYEATMRAAMDLDRPQHQQEVPQPTQMRPPQQQYDAMALQEQFRRMYEQHMREADQRIIQQHHQQQHQQHGQHQQQQQQQHEQQQQQQQQQQLQQQQHMQYQYSHQDLRIKQEEDLQQTQLPDSVQEHQQENEEASQEQTINVDQDQDPEVTAIKSEPDQPQDGQVTPPQETRYDSESVLRYTSGRADPARSPIDKPGESPDLPTDSARTQSHPHDLHDNSFGEYDPYKHKNLERMSPYDGSLNGSEERNPSSIDPEDSMESNTMNGESFFDPLARLKHALEQSGALIDKDGENSQMFQCHLCNYTSNSRFHFNDHLNTHYENKCTKCEFTASSEQEVKQHLAEEHGLTAEALEDIEGIRVPRVNAQGKVKTFKCKQCEYVSITKGDFWEHARTHIKSEKLLTCPKCPFVTEYKHHLEYHLRNHFGSKPFKCNKCNYSCVNKSMLNSHMKSHSNIYQYRCADCTYATKYCHSLKLHLRKYGHNPAMVLNPDGSPNPIPIIDVYGTRRGPKLKKDENGMPLLPPHYQLQAQIMKAQMEATGVLPMAPTQHSELNLPPSPRQTSPFTTHTSYHPYSDIHSSPILSRALEKTSEEHPRPFEGREQLRELLLERERLAQKGGHMSNGFLRCPRCEFATPSHEIYQQHMMLHVAAERRRQEEQEERDRDRGIMHERSLSPERRSSSPQPPPSLPHHLQNPPHLPQQSPGGPGHFNPLKAYLARAMNPFLYQQMMASGQIHPALMQQHLQRLGQPIFPFQRPPSQTELTEVTEIPKQEEEEVRPEPSGLTPPKSSPIHPDDHSGALDLSKEQTPTQRPISPDQSSPPCSSPRSDSSTPPSKNRRNLAFKLDHISMRLSDSAGEGENSSNDEDHPSGIREREDDEDHLLQHQKKSRVSSMPPLVPLHENRDGDDQQPVEWRRAHQCQFCDMAFKDVVMYTMHMGYHGYRDPFTCNMCGHEAQDRVAFFLHIARTAHT